MNNKNALQEIIEVNDENLLDTEQQILRPKVESKPIKERVLNYYETQELHSGWVTRTLEEHAEDNLKFDFYKMAGSNLLEAFRGVVDKSKCLRI